MRNTIDNRAGGWCRQHHAKMMMKKKTAYNNKNKKNAVLNSFKAHNEQASRRQLHSFHSAQILFFFNEVFEGKKSRLAWIAG